MKTNFSENFPIVLEIWGENTTVTFSVTWENDSCLKQMKRQVDRYPHTEKH